MKDTLVIFKQHDNWAVDWRHTPEARKVEQLFGSTVIPTPFFGPTTAATVIATLRAKNPQYNVVER